MNYFTEMANEYPYMWALYAVAIVLPFVLCAACCVKSKKVVSELIIASLSVVVCWAVRKA